MHRRLWGWDCFDTIAAIPISQRHTSNQPALAGQEAAVDTPSLRNKGGLIGRGRPVGRGADHRGPTRYGC
jgi:hypothetical protein